MTHTTRQKIHGWVSPASYKPSAVDFPSCRTSHPGSPTVEHAGILPVSALPLVLWIVRLTFLPKGQALAAQGKSRGGSLSWFIFVLSNMPFSPHGLAEFSERVFFLAKVGQLGGTPINKPTVPGQILRRTFRRFTNLGIPQNFSQNFLAYPP